MKSIFLTLFLALCSFSAYAEELPKLLPADGNTLDSLLAENKGKVVLVNLWAEWCAPCKEEFPHIIQLDNETSDDELAVIFVTLDVKEALETNTIPFLTASGYTKESYYHSFASDELAMAYFQKFGWEGAIPATFIFSKEGEMKTYLLGSQTYETFKTEVEKLK